MDEGPRAHAETVAEWAAWPEANHASATGVWLVTWRAATGRPAPSYEEATEAVRAGWIVQAKGPATGARRVAETAEKAARRERADQWTRKR